MARYNKGNLIELAGRSAQRQVIEEALARFRTRAEQAAALGTSSQNLTRWMNRLGIAHPHRAHRRHTE